MKKNFKTEIDSELSHSFEIEKEGLYAISVRASCNPGWRNQWWLRFKNLLEDILDLHLDDEDLRVEIDDLVFRKPKGKRGLFNSPAAFSGTKTLGKIKTVVFITYLTEGSHTIEFIPDGSPYLEGIEVEEVNNPKKLIFYLDVQAEDENYYSWLTFALIDFPLKTIYITAKAGVAQGETDDDDLKIIINGKEQENEENSHPKSYFCGFTLRGIESTFSKELNLIKSTHYLELFADKQPTLQSVEVHFTEEPDLNFGDPSKTKDEFNPKYALKDALSEEQIETFLQKYGEEYPNHIYHKTIEGRKVSYWIKKFTFEAEINPRVIITKLQAEKGLIVGEKSLNPTQEQIDWALGAGSTDEGRVAKYKGFYTQLKEAPYLFRSYFAELDKPPFIKQVDGEDLIVVNKATYAFYRYTPHVAGANLFSQVYSQFFGKDDLGGQI